MDDQRLGVGELLLVTLVAWIERVHHQRKMCLHMHSPGRDPGGRLVGEGEGAEGGRSQISEESWELARAHALWEGADLCLDLEGQVLELSGLQGYHRKGQSQSSLMMCPDGSGRVRERRE